jgi:hypothetical protein
MRGKKHHLVLFFILGFCILLRILYQGYWKNCPSQQLLKVFISIYNIYIYIYNLYIYNKYK